jgi:hypothetical protein
METIEEKVKAYCEWEYTNCLRYDSSIKEALDRCYGAVMFCINFYSPTYNKELADWWEDEMFPKFRKTLNYSYEYKYITRE